MADKDKLRFLTGQEDNLGEKTVTRGQVYFAIDSDNDGGKIYFDAPIDATTTKRIVMSGDRANEADHATEADSAKSVKNSLIIDGKEYNGSAETKVGNTIYYIEANSTDSTAGTWTGSHSSITSYYNGLTVIFVPKVAGGSSTTTLNINGLGAKTCYYTGTSKLTTHFPVGTPIIFTYIGGNWKRADFNSDINLRVYKDETAENYPILASRTLASGYTSAYRSAYGEVSLTNPITMTPSTGTITANYFEGTAKRATNDSNSSKITETYISEIKLNDAGTAILYKAPDIGTWSEISPKFLPLTGGTITGELYADSITAKDLLVNGSARFVNTILGNIETADKWKTARSFQIADSGAAHSGTAVSVDGSGDIVLKLPDTIAAALKGNADTATALTSSAGSTTQPIYFKDGKPVAITGAIANDTTGNAATATQWKNKHNFITALNSESSASVDGSGTADYTMGVSGVLPISHGGTGKTTANDAANALLSGLPTWTASPEDTTVLIRRNLDGTETYGKVTFLTVWNYVKSKFAADTSGTYGGTAEKANQLVNSHTFITALNSESTGSFNGTQDVTMGVSGILPVAHGGTGVTSIANIQAGKDGNGDTISDTYLKRSGGTVYGPVTFSASTEIDDLTSGDLLVTGQASFNNTIKGTIEKADKLATARTMITALNSESSASFDGTTNVTLGVSGILPVAHGGTGKSTGNDAANYFLNALGTGSSTPVDEDYYISQYVGGGTTTTTYHRRPMSALWAYIQGKLKDDTTGTYGGTAAKADQLTNSHTFITALNSESTGSFDGTADVTMGVSGTLPTSHGGTGNTSYTANRMIYSESATKLSSSGHYVSSTKVAINSTSEPSYNLYNEGTTYLKGAITHAATVTFANKTWNLVGDDCYFGDHDVAGGIGIMGKNGNTRLDWCKKDAASTYQSIIFDGSTLYASSKFGVAGSNSSYNFYVNGTSYLNGNLTVSTAGVVKIQNTTDSANSQDSNACLAVQGGISVAKQLSAKTVRIDGSSSDGSGSATQGCTVNFNKTLNCIEFVFD